MRPHYFDQDTADGDDTDIPVDVMEAAYEVETIARAILAEREACCAAVCQYCAAGIPVRLGMVWLHYPMLVCEAQAIRSRSQ